MNITVQKVMKKFFSLLFNIAETGLIILIAWLLKVPKERTITIILLFFLTRAIIAVVFGEKPSHYKDWYRCLIWSSLVMLSLFVFSKADIVITILATIFTAYISTSAANINEEEKETAKGIDISDMYMWKGTASNYQDIMDYIKYNPLNSDILEFEKRLKQLDSLQYLIYKYRFRDNLTFKEIEEKIEGMTSQRIEKELKIIATSIRIYCGI